MFLGHFAVGFAAKRAAPETSLGTLMAAALLPDLLWPVFILAGWERVRVAPGDTAVTPLAFDSYPFSHSLLATLGWAAFFAAIFWMGRRYRAGAVVTGLAVVSHWVLDWVAHRPDLPLWPGAEIRVGLGLWNSVPATLAVELSMFIAGVFVYASGTRARDHTGRFAFWPLVLFLSAIYLGSVFGPLPPSPQAVAFVDLAGWMLVLWAAWVDRHREVRMPGGEA